MFNRSHRTSGITRRCPVRRSVWYCHLIKNIPRYNVPGESIPDQGTAAPSPNRRASPGFTRSRVIASAISPGDRPFKRIPVSLFLTASGRLPSFMAMVGTPKYPASRMTFGNASKPDNRTRQVAPEYSSWSLRTSSGSILSSLPITSTPGYPNLGLAPTINNRAVGACSRAIRNASTSSGPPLLTNHIRRRARRGFVCRGL